jgi:hypothetical protein
VFSYIRRGQRLHKSYFTRKPERKKLMNPTSDDMPDDVIRMVAIIAATVIHLGTKTDSGVIIAQAEDIRKYIKDGKK